MRFAIRDLLWLVLVAAILSVWWGHEQWRNQIIKDRQERTAHWPEIVLEPDHFLRNGEKMELWMEDKYTLVSRIKADDRVTVERHHFLMPRVCGIKAGKPSQVQTDPLP